MGGKLVLLEAVQFLECLVGSRLPLALFFDDGDQIESPDHSESEKERCVVSEFDQECCLRIEIVSPIHAEKIAAPVSSEKKNG